MLKQASSWLLLSVFFRIIKSSSNTVPSQYSLPTTTMLLRNSISNTKKFFRRTLQNFKSFFSTTEYHRLPKTSPSPLIHMETHQTHPELEKMLNNTQQWDSEKENAERTRSREKKKLKEIEKIDNERKNMIITHHHKDSDSESESESESAVRNFYMVERKLRELEMLDMGNVDYVLDIEEVLHYYSRLTCPAYLEIVDTFFMQIYSEFFAPLPKLPPPK